MTIQVFSQTLVCASHVRSFSVSRNSGVGWELQELEDERVLRQQVYADWHRLERALHGIHATIEELKRDGWEVAG